MSGNLDLTMMSVITTSLFMSLLIFVLCTLFRSGAVLRRIGPKCMILLLLAMLVRMLLPFEFPYTYSIYIEDVFTPFRWFLSHTVFTVGALEWTVWYTIVFLWITGAVVLFFYKIRIYRKVLRLAELLPKVSWDEFCMEYQINPQFFENRAGVQLAYCNSFYSPCLVGWKKRYLILPHIDYGKEQMRYIVLHELSHARNRDIAWKLLTELLCMVFWWNPVFWYLKRELFCLVEMRNDLLVTADFSEKEKTGYMECLKDTARQMAGKDLAASAAFNRNDFRSLKKRLELLDSRKPFSRRWQIMVSTLASVAMVLSSSVIFEPFGINREEGVVRSTEDNTYLIRNGEEYDVYIDEEYFFTTKDLSSFDGFEIYNNSEEAEENER